MTRFLAAEDIAALATHDLTMRAARAAVEAGTRGTAHLPPRLDLDLEGGFLRVMPGALDEIMGVKVMTNAKGVGNHYLLLVYRQSDGELLALLDADEITRLRTAATTALAAHILQPAPQVSLALIGTGFEATGHLRALAHLWPLERVYVYSPSPERRVAFADRMSEELAIAVEPVDSSHDACAAARTLVLATKSKTPVLDGEDLMSGSVVLSIGSTRPDLRELDRETLSRTATLLVDDVRQVGIESGDVLDAFEQGLLQPAQLLAMSEAFAAPEPPATHGERDVLTFKSVGTAIQDLALAAALNESAAAQGRGRELGVISRLKPFSSVAAR